MKQFSYKLIVLAIATFGAFSVNAQFIKELGERVKERAKWRTEQKVEEKTDQALDSIFVDRSGRGMDSQDSEESEGSTSNKGNFSSSKSYQFEFEATIEIENYEKKKTQKNTIVQSYGEGALFSTVEGSQVIHDFEDEMAYVIDSDNMEAQALSLSFFMKRMGNAEKEDDGDATITKTGKTEVINGYICHEYIIDHEDGKMEVWFAPDVDFDYSDYMKGFSKMLGKKTKTPSSEEGYVMRMTGFDTDDEKIMHMEVIDFKEATQTISLADYNVTKLL